MPWILSPPFSFLAKYLTYHHLLASDGFSLPCITSACALNLRIIEMDPVSIFGTTATIVAISLQLGSAIQSLAQLKIKVSSADLTVHSLIRRLSVIQYAIKDIRAWDDDNRTPSPASIEFKDALSVSLDGCSTILQSLNEQISQIHTDGEFTHWQKGKFVWKESLLKDYLGYLDGEIQALNLLLNSHQW